MKKIDVRKKIESGMNLFLAEGKVITKVNSKKKKQKPMKEVVVEINTDFIPAPLRDKYFIR